MNGIGYAAAIAIRFFAVLTGALIIISAVRWW